jgi:hypothetical protein
VPGGCALPTKLQVTPNDSPLAQALMKRWPAGDREPLSCELALVRDGSDLMGTAIQAAFAGLTCGKLHASAFIGVDKAVRAKPLDALSGKLLQQVIAGTCGR